jgi:uncharacterized phage protein (predicted DNA packaging)
LDQTELTELKEWLKIDGTEEDKTLSSLLLSSKFVIKQATGIKLEDIAADDEAKELYKTIQRMIITDIYENRGGSGKVSPVVISLCAQLEAYKPETITESGGIS